MARRRGRKKPKEIQVKLITRQDEKGTVRQCYQMLEALIAEHHRHLSEAKIALAWHMGWKADADGHLKYGMAKKASDLDHELHAYDFVIVLNFQVWNGGDFPEKSMLALLDHELCHCSVSKDKHGEEKRDAGGRLVYRIRKHDLEEFSEIVARHGLWKRDIEHFVRTAAASTQGVLFAVDHRSN